MISEEQAQTLLHRAGNAIPVTAMPLNSVIMKARKHAAHRRVATFGVAISCALIAGGAPLVYELTGGEHAQQAIVTHPETRGTPQDLHPRVACNGVNQVVGTLDYVKRPEFESAAAAAASWQIFGDERRELVESGPGVVTLYVLRPNGTANTSVIMREADGGTWYLATFVSCPHSAPGTR